MTNQHLLSIIEICREARCSMKLDACQSGISVTIGAHRGAVFVQTTAYLDRNDKDIAATLQAAIDRVREQPA